PANYRPVWLPDSARVAFLSSDGQRTRLRVADVTSRRTELLMDLGPERPRDPAQRTVVNGALDFRVSPDARVVAFSDVEPATGVLDRLLPAGWADETP